MAYLTCPDCSQRVANMYAHDCPKAKSSRGGAESRRTPVTTGKPSAGAARQASVKPTDVSGIEARQDRAGVAPSPRENKRGRPRLEEKRPASSKPWIAEKMSRASWYRRQADARKK